MATPRNIILIVTNSNRYDSVHDTEDAGLPHVFPRATVFSQARSAGCWTLPATASLFTGLLPHEHGADVHSRGLRTDIPTLAQILKHHGYRTHQVTANIATSHIFGLDRGFEDVRSIWQHVPTVHRNLVGLTVLFGKPQFRNTLLSRDFIRKTMSYDLTASKVWLQSTAKAIFNHARQILHENEAKNQRSFLYLNLMESHFPYHVDATFRLTSNGWFEKLMELYSLYHLVNQTWLTKKTQPIPSDMIAKLRLRQVLAWKRLAPMVDAYVNELLTTDGNLVIFMSDHGECFGEQGWLYHYSNVADGGNRVPILWWSHEESAGETINVPVSSRDLFHAILAAVADTRAAFNPLIEPERSVPIMESFWYNNRGKTRPEYRFNQFCFLDKGVRWLNRSGVWHHAIVTTRDEARFNQIDPAVNPIKKIEDKQRRESIERAFEEFIYFSTRHLA